MLQTILLFICTGALLYVAVMVTLIFVTVHDLSESVTEYLFETLDSKREVIIYDDES